MRLLPIHHAVHGPQFHLRLHLPHPCWSQHCHDPPFLQNSIENHNRKKTHHRLRSGSHWSFDCWLQWISRIEFLWHWWLQSADSGLSTDDRLPFHIRVSNFIRAAPHGKIHNPPSRVRWMGRVLRSVCGPFNLNRTDLRPLQLWRIALCL